MGIGPASPNPCLDDQRHRQLGRALHHVPRDLRQRGRLVLRGFEQQFVMHLQKHPALQTRLRDGRRRPGHLGLPELWLPGRTRIGGAPEGEAEEVGRDPAEQREEREQERGHVRRPSG